IVTGFVAKNEEGQITTLGRGGSDYTAAIIGAAVKAEEIQIWTDVYGMMTANPKIVAEAKSILRISFNEAAELAFFGAKVLHPKTIIPAVKSNIPVTILNSFDPDHEGTTILAEVPVGDSVVRAISLRKDITLFKIKSSRMLLMHGFLAKLFEAFDKNQISVDMIATSEISVSMTFDNKNVDEKLEKIKQELAGIGEIYIEHGKAIISLVGIGLENDLEALNRISSTILNNGIQIHLISKGASEINIGFVIDDKDGEKAVKCLHKEFFE
ncbi:aspartate kinase, partial [bacterium]|nr:aspartate kinase [bacterium]